MPSLDRAPIQRVTSLPGSPYQGQEVVYVADAANGVEWHLRYDTNITADSGAYKWAFVGGGKLTHEVATNENSSSASFVNLTTTGPTITVPLAGVFVATLSMNCYANTIGGAPTAALDWTGHAASLSNNDFMIASMYAASKSTSIAREATITLTSAALAVVMKYVSDGTISCNFRQRILTIQPLRVG